MNKSFIALMAGVSLLVSSTVWAMPNTNRVEVTNAKSGKVLQLPERAVEVTDGVFYLGSEFDEDSGEMVQGYAIVHPKVAKKRPSKSGGGGTTPSVCYTYMADGAKWKTVEPWLVDATNPYNLDQVEVFSILENGIAKWEDATDGRINGSIGRDVLGDGSYGVAGVDFEVAGTLDGKNGVVFGQLDPGTIGVTYVWGVFGGPVKRRQLVEWDQIYNTYYPWSTDLTPNTMDFDSIVTHELGHSFGMGDLYQTECSLETMYGYGGYNDIHARDLHDGDIAGINKFY